MPNYYDEVAKHLVELNNQRKKEEEAMNNPQPCPISNCELVHEHGHEAYGSLARFTVRPEVLRGQAPEQPGFKWERTDSDLFVVSSHYTDGPDNHEHVVVGDDAGGEMFHVWGYAMWVDGTVTPIVYSGTGHSQRGMFTIHPSYHWHHVTIKANPGGAV